MDREIKLKTKGEHTPGEHTPHKGEKAPNHTKGGNTPGEHTPYKGQTPYKGDQTPRMVIANHQTGERAPNHTTGESTTRRVNIGNILPH